MSTSARATIARALRQSANPSPAHGAGGTRGAASRRVPRAPVRTLLVTGAAITGTGLLLAACSSGPQAAAPGGTPAMRKAAQAQRAPVAPVPGSAASGDLTFNTAAGARAVHLPRTTSMPLPPSQSIIYTANLTVRAKDVTTAASLATNAVMGVGGYVAGEQVVIPPSGTPGTAQVNLTLKIPVARYPAMLTSLKALGRPIMFSQHATDVTQEVVDVNSRVTSAQAAITQLRTLLSRAGTVGDLLAVQDQINSQEANLEALLAQQRALAHETSYATVSMLILGPHQLVVHHKKGKRHGFVAGLAAGWHALGAAVTALLTAIGAALPFVVIVALAGVIVVGSRRRNSRRRPSAPPPVPPSATS